MRHTVYKLFIATQYEQEEKWINEMSAKGLALVHVGLCKYVFEDAEPGKYTYKIELLDHFPSAASSKSYLTFLEDAGIEHIASMLRWVYLRKETADGPFALYSDADSTIRYFRRLQVFFITLTVLEFAIGIQNILIGSLVQRDIHVVNIAMGLLLLLLGVFCAIASYTHTKKLRALRRERQIRE